jgi:hypothetical protein
MQIDRNISWGNIISWIVIIVGLGVGYGNQSAATAQNAKDVKEAKELAASVAADLRVSDAARSVQITNLTVGVAKS